MKALIIGGSGQVGTWLQRTSPEGVTVVATATRPIENHLLLDITNKQAVFDCINNLQPDVILLPASYTHVDGCEQNPDTSRKINVHGIWHVVEAAEARKIVFFSSDYVFNGQRGDYSEDEAPEPLSVYGEHKVQAEQLVGLKNLIIRTSVVYSYLQGSKNIAMQLLERGKNNSNIQAVADQIGSPTYAPDLARITWNLILRNATGIFHVAGPEAMSRYDFAKEMSKVFGWESNVEKIETSQLDQLAKRPNNASLDSQKMQATIGTHAMSVKEALKEMKASVL